ncbi:MAG: hypothetical protein GF334_06805 [Candidatus Altiarchaeales archaeon]|nr:hypothetical protein [Candidatus Altiarchaeales archaeon]
MHHLVQANKGIMGIGTLIIFIAIIIVSAVAAAVLIGSAGSLEGRSMAAQRGTEEQVTGGIQIVNVVGGDARNHSKVDDLEVMMRLKPGSDPINFNTTVFTIDTRITTQTIRYIGNQTPTRSYYSLSYLQSGVSHRYGYLSLGDTAIANLKLATNITEQEEVTVQAIPRAGGITKIRFRTPNVMVDKRIFLYP